MSFLIFILILGVLILVHEFGHFLLARLCGVKVEVFAIGFGPPLFKFKFKSFDFYICLILWGGYVRLAGFERGEYKGKPWEFLSKPLRIRAKIVLAGPFFNYLFSWILFCLMFLIGIEVFSNRVGELKEGWPAQRAGIKEGDIILEVEGKPTKTWQDITEIIHNTKKENIEIVVLREGKKIRFNLHPKQEEIKDIFGKRRVFSFIGVYPSSEKVKLKYSFLEAIKEASLRLLRLSFLTFKALFYIIIGALPFKESLTGPLGIYYITKQASQIGLSAILHLMAVLSMSLTIFNILPLPVLDGGHLFFLVIEKIRGKALSPKTEEIINRIGLSFIFILIFLVLYNDIIRFGSRIFER